MSRFCSINNNFPYDNNILVLDMVLSSLWGVPQPIDWDNVARLVPGFTPKECARRFEELKSSGGFLHVDTQCNSLPKGSGMGANVPSNLMDPSMEVEESRLSPCSVSVTGQSVGADGGGDSVAEEEDQAEGREGPIMVIHVCDEAKNLQQDFACPRELLLQEMRYFSDYLSSEPQRWEEVDISVHCDVQIFQWLMSYVKWKAGDINDRPQLEPSNVISILISSEFLKMDTLVEECVQFCHQHMAAVVATPCNMSCISDGLVSRIAHLFTHSEAEELKDKKDKFKSKLFQKKIERLFDPEYKNCDSPGNASTLYRCGLCNKLLTKETESKVSCIPGKINVDHRGNIMYSHSRHKNWDVHEYLNGLYEELKSWPLVYWRIWGTVNFLNCTRCKQVFLCTELSQCRYHPEAVVYSPVGAEPGQHGTGVFPCCQQRTIRFDPACMPKGCMLRDHCVSPSADRGDSEPGQNRLLNDLLQHRDAVCVAQSPAESSGGGERALECDILLEPGVLEAPKQGEVITFSLLKNWSLQLRQQCLLSEDEEYTTGSEVTEDEVGDEEEVSKRQAAKKAKRSGRPLRRQMSSPSLQRKEKTADKTPSKDASSFLVTLQRNKWDSTRSMRFNQDAQREEDQRRMAEIVAHLTKMRFGDMEQNKAREKEQAGGLYSRLEAQLKFSQASSRQTSSEKSGRVRTRHGHAKASKMD